MSQDYSTETLNFTQGESPSWVFDLFQDNEFTKPFGVSGYTLNGAIGYPFGNVRYLLLPPSSLFISGPNQITLLLTAAQTLALPTGVQSRKDPPNLALSIWGEIGNIGSNRTSLIRSQMRSLAMVPLNG